MKKTSKIIFIIACFTIMSVPGLAMLVGKEQPNRLSENRTIATWPDKSGWEFFTDKGEYASGVNSFFDDNFYYRSTLIRSKNEILLHAFNVTKEVYLGEDGYMFYRWVVDGSEIVNEKMGEEGKNELTETLIETKDYLENKGKKFFFLFPPQKNELLPETLPNSEANRPEPNMYQRVRASFEADPRLNSSWVDSFSILKEANEYYPVFYKTDFHWNGYGATKAYTDIVNRLAAAEGYQEPIFNDSLYTVYMQEGFTGVQPMNLPLFTTPTETAPFTQKNSEITSALVDANDTYKILHYVNYNPNAPLGSVLFIGDSYTEFLLSSNSGILDCFRECYFVHIDWSENAYETYLDKVDYVVFERVASGLNDAAKYLNNLYPAP